MAARRIRRAHHGRLWRPARVATPTRPPTGTTTPPSRQPVRTAAARHQARPGRPRHAARAPPPALTPAPPGRPGCRSGAPLDGRNPGTHRRPRGHQPQKPHGITRKGAGQQPQMPTARGGAPDGPRRCCRSRDARSSCPSHAPASAQPRCAGMGPQVAGGSAPTVRAGRQAFLPIPGSIPGWHWCTTVWFTWTLTAPSALVRDRAGLCGPASGCRECGRS